MSQRRDWTRVWEGEYRSIRDQLLLERRAGAVPRRRIGQAEDRDIGPVQRVPARLRVLPLGVGELDELQIRPSLKPRPDLQPGGSRLAIDEDFCRHCLCPAGYRPGIYTIGARK